MEAAAAAQPQAEERNIFFRDGGQAACGCIAAALVNMAASLSWCGISICTGVCFGLRANDRLFGKIGRDMSLRQDAPILRGLARTAACSGKS